MLGWLLSFVAGYIFGTFVVVIILFLFCDLLSLIMAVYHYFSLIATILLLVIILLSLISSNIMFLSFIEGLTLFLAGIFGDWERQATARLNFFFFLSIFLKNKMCTENRRKKKELNTNKNNCGTIKKISTNDPRFPEYTKGWLESFAERFCETPLLRKTWLCHNQSNTSRPHTENRKRYYCEDQLWYVECMCANSIFCVGPNYKTRYTYQKLQ